MASPNIVPRADSEGGLGTASKYWGAAYINTITTTSHINLPDNAILKIGTGSDLKISHDGTDSVVQNDTGDLEFQNRQNDGDIVFKSDDGSGGVTPYITLDGGDVSTIVNTVKVLMPNLPTSDPSVAGQLYNDSGTLKISAG